MCRQSKKFDENYFDKEIKFNILIKYLNYYIINYFNIHNKQINSKILQSDLKEKFFLYIYFTVCE